VPFLHRLVLGLLEWGRSGTAQQPGERSPVVFGGRVSGGPQSPGVNGVQADPPEAFRALIVTWDASGPHVQVMFRLCVHTSLPYSLPSRPDVGSRALISGFSSASSAKYLSGAGQYCAVSGHGDGYCGLPGLVDRPDQPSYPERGNQTRSSARIADRSVPAW
jgi:hypothetical protein